MKPEGHNPQWTGDSRPSFSGERPPVPLRHVTTRNVESDLSDPTLPSLQGLTETFDGEAAGTLPGTSSGRAAQPSATEAAAYTPQREQPVTSNGPWSHPPTRASASANPAQAPRGTQPLRGATSPRPTQEQPAATHPSAGHRPQADAPTVKRHPGYGIGATANGAGAEHQSTIPPLTYKDVFRYLKALQWALQLRAGQPDIPIEPHRREDFDMAYRTLQYIMSQYRDHLRQRGTFGDVLGVFEMGIAHFKLSQKLTAGEFSALQEVIGVVRDREQHPERIQGAIARHQQFQGALGEASPVRSASTSAQQPTAAAKAHSAAQQPAQPQPERGPQLTDEELAYGVVSAAASSTLIRTSVAEGTTVLYGNRPDQVPTSGQRTFGVKGHIGKDVPRHLSKPIGSHNPIVVQKPDGSYGYADDVVEAFSFTSASVNGRPVMSTNPLTGQRERGVRFDYAYNPWLSGKGDSDEAEKRLGLPKYKEVDGSRGGNYLIVTTVFPESIARDVYYRAEADPTSVRTVAGQIITSGGGVPVEDWEQGRGDLNRIKPPYEGLPSSHKIFLLSHFDHGSKGSGYLARPL